MGKGNILIFRNAEHGAAVRDPIWELADWFAAHAGAVTGYASERAYGRRSAPALRTVTYAAIPTARSSQSHLKRSILRACAIPPKAPPILLRGGTFGGITHLKRRKTLQAFLV